MPPPLVTPGELPPALVAGEGFLPGVRANVGGEMVAAAEVPHADAALEGLVARVETLMLQKLCVGIETLPTVRAEVRPLA